MKESIIGTVLGIVAFFIAVIIYENTKWHSIKYYFQNQKNQQSVILESSSFDIISTLSKVYLENGYKIAYTQEMTLGDSRKRIILIKIRISIKKMKPLHYYSTEFLVKLKNVQSLKHTPLIFGQNPSEQIVKEIREELNRRNQ